MFNKPLFCHLNLLLSARQRPHNLGFLLAQEDRIEVFSKEAVSRNLSHMCFQQFLTVHQWKTKKFATCLHAHEFINPIVVSDDLVSIEKCWQNECCTEDDDHFW
jgi:hypothetical protein